MITQQVYEPSSGKDEKRYTGQQSHVRRMKSVEFKFLGVKDEDLENLPYFAKKANEEAIRKRQESVNGGDPFVELPWVKKSVDLMDLDLVDVNGSLTLFHYSKKAHEKAIRKPKQCSFHSHCSVPPFRLDLYVSKKQRSNRRKAMMCTNTIGFSKIFGNPVPEHLKSVEQVGHNRKGLKRCRESTENEELKRQKDGKIQKKKGPARLAEWGLEPPPNMPIEFKNLVEEMGGSEEKLLIQKIIFKTDLRKTHNRLQIPENQVMVTDFLTEEEAKKLDGEEGLNVVLIEPCMKKSRIHLTKWSMGNSKVFVLNEQWNSAVEGKKTLMKKNAVMQIWSFRTVPESKLCFAMIKVRDGDDD